MPGHGSSHIDSPFTEEYTWQNAADDFYSVLVSRGLPVASCETGTNVLLEWQEALATGPVHLVGSAVGGLTALRLALSHPEITESLTLVAPPLEDEPEFVEEAFDEWLKVSGIYSLSTKKMGLTSLQETEKAAADRDIESLESLSNYVFDFCTGQVGDPALREMMDEYGYMVQVKMASGEASNLPRHNLQNLT